MSGKNATKRLAPDDTGLAEAAKILAAGGLVAVPTETVYGLAARADSDAAVSKIYAAKGRPGYNPLIVHVLDLEAASQLAVIDERAEKLAQAFWPGPMTMILPLKASADLADAVTAGLPTLAVRAPAHPVMRSLLAETGLPLAAPSANRSETVSPTGADHVLRTLDGRIDAVIDEGECERGIESTIVALRDFSGWEVLRPGPITQAEIAGILGPATASKNGEAIEAPGQMARHYAPGKPLRLNAVSAEPDEFFIGFGDVSGEVTLSASADLEEAAAALYRCLHLAAGAQQSRIAIAPVPDEGVGRAINDRLRRAAAN